MAKIDTSGWKEFRVGDLFDVQTTKSLDKLQLEFSDDYEYDFVGRSYVNNGIQGHLKKQSFEPNPANTFSVVQIGEQVCLYRENEWYASQNIFILKPKYKKVKETSFFMSCIITKTIKIKFGDNAYASYPTKNSLIDTAIPLPVDTNGNPDWEYMEEYMTEVMRESEESIENLKQVSQEKKKVDITEWKEFHLYDPHMFRIDMGNKFDKTKMDMTEDEINFVGRTALNNGINAVCKKIEGVTPYSKGCLTLALGGSIGSCFVQERDFYTSQNVIVLKPMDNIPWKARWFVACAIHKESDLHYQAFVNELNAHIKKDFVVSLPADSDGNPDWEYMEEYMSAIMKESEDNLTNLSLIL